MRVIPFLVVETTVTTPSTTTSCPTYFEASQAEIVGGSARDRDGSHTVNKKAKTDRRKNVLMSLYHQYKLNSKTELSAPDPGALQGNFGIQIKRLTDRLHLDGKS